MHRVDELLDWLAQRPSTGASCGSTLVAIADRDVSVQTCPRCDTTPGTQPRPDHGVPHGRIHFTEIPGCPDCVQARRARI